MFFLFGDNLKNFIFFLLIFNILSIFILIVFVKVVFKVNNIVFGNIDCNFFKC